MPPKIKISKERIIAAALSIVRRSGAEALNARAVAKELECSTQPVFSNYSSMRELKNDVIVSANNIYIDYVKKAMDESSLHPYKASGMAYISFAREERELFKLLFMRDRSEENTGDGWAENAEAIRMISQNVGITPEEAYLFHMEMWIYVHGIAVMIATSYLEWEPDTISMMVTDAYRGAIERFKNREEK